MANLVDKSGDAYSNIVHGDGTNEVSFRMPGNVPLDVESVVATVDNGAGGDTTAKLTVRDASGEVIATRLQGDPIPAGDTGTATFALRLGADGGGIKYDRVNTGNFLDVRTIGRMHFQSGGDMTLRGDGGFHVDGFRELALVSHSLVNPLLLFSSTGVVLQDNTNTSTHQLINGGVVGGVSGSLALIETFGGAVGNPHSVVIRMFDAKNVQIEDSQGNALFRVDANGDLHGKTGKALVFDL